MPQGQIFETASGFYSHRPPVDLALKTVGYGRHMNKGEAILRLAKSALTAVPKARPAKVGNVKATVVPSPAVDVALCSQSPTGTLAPGIAILFDGRLLAEYPIYSTLKIEWNGSLHLLKDLVYKVNVFDMHLPELRNLLCRHPTLCLRSDRSIPSHMTEAEDTMVLLSRILTIRSQLQV